MPQITDNFADATEVVVATNGGTWSADSTNNSTYTTESGEPAVSASATRSGWAKYTPGSSGTATFDTQQTTTAGSHTDTVLAIWTGTALNNLVLVASSDDEGGSGTSLISNLAVTAGTTYWLQVGAFGTAIMNYGLRVVGPASATAAAPAFDPGAFDAAAFWATSGASLTRSVGDTAAASDTTSVVITRARAVGDSAPAADALTRASASSRALADVAAAADTSARSASRTRALSDSAAAADATSTSTTGSPNRSIGDSAPAVDVSTRQQTRARALADTAAASDTLARASSKARALTESATASDVTSASSTGNLARTVVDSAPAADTLARLSSRARSTSDVAAASDSTTARRQLARQLGEAAPATELSAQALQLSRQLLDAALAVDELTWSFTSGEAPISVVILASIAPRSVAASLQPRSATGTLKPRTVTAGVIA